jgi:hypothetical protein
MGTSLLPTGRHNGGEKAPLDDEYMMLTYKVSFDRPELQRLVLGGADAVAEIRNFECKCLHAVTICSTVEVVHMRKQLFGG